MEDYRKQIADEESNKNAEKRKLQGMPTSNTEDKGRGQKEDDMVHSLKMNKALGVLERMVNQNAEDEIFQDFKFWEDVSTVRRSRNVQIALNYSDEF
jgi:dynein intermediate chain 1, axonemal